MEEHQLLYTKSLKVTSCLMLLIDSTSPHSAPIIGQALCKAPWCKEEL